MIILLLVKIHNMKPVLIEEDAFKMGRFKKKGYMSPMLGFPSFTTLSSYLSQPSQ